MLGILLKVVLLKIIKLYVNNNRRYLNCSLAFWFYHLLYYRWFYSYSFGYCHYYDLDTVNYGEENYIVVGKLFLNKIKEMNKKIKSVAKGVAKKTKELVKTAKKKGGKAVVSFKKQWKKEQPRREKYGKEVKAAAKKALEGGIKIGSDIVETIKKDIKEINSK